MSAAENLQESEVELDASNAAERRTLKWVLAINLLQFAVAGAVGMVADSTGLLGAALDNLADAGVYLVSLYAVGRTVVAKSFAATLSGVLLIGLVVIAIVVKGGWDILVEARAARRGTALPK